MLPHNHVSFLIATIFFAVVPFILLTESPDQGRDTMHSSRPIAGGTDERKMAHCYCHITRQLGSGGSYIGYEIARELSFKYASHEILRKAVERLHVETALEEYENRSGNFFENFLQWYSFGTPENAYPVTMKPPIYERDLFSVECSIVNEIVDQHDAVIVGRAGFSIPRDRPGVIRVFVHAAPEFRINRVAQAQHVPVREAQAKVKQSDKTKIRFVRDVTGIEWTDARNYDLCIDSSAVGLSAAVETVMGLILRKQTDT